MLEKTGHCKQLITTSKGNLKYKGCKYNNYVTNNDLHIYLSISITGIELSQPPLQFCDCGVSSLLKGKS